MDVSLRAPWYLVMKAFDHMTAGSRIVNISSVLGEISDPGRFPYDVAKSGLHGLTRSMAVNLSQFGIAANALVLGDIALDYLDQEVDDNPWRVECYPSNRSGTPEDVAAVAAFLASDDAAFINGASIPVDGGRLVTHPTSRWPDPDQN
jgi:NAD(P)-dependent dehydrogenase (short-subunit alcohol dehydrogenase family)